MTEPRTLRLLTGLGALAFLGLLAAPVLLGRFYLYDDLLTFHLPLRVFYARCLAHGDDFRWFPNYYGGMDLHGEGQIGLLHPAHLLLYGILPVRIAFPVEFLAQYVLLYVGMWLFLRRWVETPAAIVGALTFSGFGYSILHFMHINSIGIVAHLPWSLWLADHLLRSPSKPGVLPGVGLSLLTGSELLVGHPQTVWYVKLVEAAYVLFLVVRFGGRSRFPLYVGYTMAGILIGAVQLVPTWETLQLSRRASMTADAILMGSLHPMNLTQLVAPYALLERYVPSHGGTGWNQFIKLHEVGLYQGAILVPLLVGLAMRWKAMDSSQRQLVRWALMLAVFGLLIALGDYGPMGWLLTKVPLVRSFRVPARYLLIVHAALAIVAAVAFEVVLKARPDNPRALAWLLTVPFATLACVLAFRVWDRLDPEAVPALGTTARTGANLLLITAGCVLVGLAPRAPRLVTAGVMAVMTLDFAAYGLYFHLWDSMPVLAQALEPHPEVSAIQPGYRLDIKLPRPGVVYPERRGQYRSGQLSMAGYRLTEGYVAFEPQRVLTYETDAERRLGSVALAWDDDLDGGTWRAVSNPLPRAYLTYRTVQVNKRPLEFVSTPPFVAFTEQPLTLAEGPEGDLKIEADRPGRFQVRVQAPKTRLLIWSEAYHPGWKVELDGRRTDILRVNFDFQGCVVPAGEHLVDFRYRPQSFETGLRLSILGVCLTAAIAFVQTATRRIRWRAVAMALILPTPVFAAIDSPVGTVKPPVARIRTGLERLFKQEALATFQAHLEGKEPPQHAGERDRIVWQDEKGPELPDSVRQACQFYEQAVAERDIGSVRLRRVWLGGRSIFVVEVRTDGDDGWLELYDARGEIWGAAHMVLEIPVWDDLNRVREEPLDEATRRKAAARSIWNQDLPDANPSNQ